MKAEGSSHHCKQLGPPAQSEDPVSGHCSLVASAMLPTLPQVQTTVVFQLSVA